MAFPVLSIEAATVAPDQTTVTLSGAIDLQDASTPIGVFDGATELETVGADASGDWSTTISVSAAGAHVLTAQASGSNGTGVSNAVLDLVAGASASLTGGGQFVLFSGAGDVVNLSYTFGNWDLVQGSGGTISQSGAEASVVGGSNAITLQAVTPTHGYTFESAVSLYFTNNAWDSVYASSCTINLTHAQTSLSGGFNTVYVDNSSINVLSVYDTNNAFDTIYADSLTVNLTQSQAVLFGGANTAYLDGSASDILRLGDTSYGWDTVYGSNAFIYVSQAQASLVGRANTVYLDGSSSDILSLYDTTYGWDTVYASNAIVNLTQAQADLIGGGDRVYVDNSPSNVLSVYDTDSVWNTIYADNLTVNVTQSQASLYGGANTVYLDGSSSDILSLYDTGYGFDTVYGSNAEINLNSGQASVHGGNDSINSSETAVVLSLYDTSGAYDTLAVGGIAVDLTRAQASVTGVDTIDLDGSPSDVAIISTNFEFDTINGSNGTLGILDSDATVNGSNDTFDVFAGGGFSVSDIGYKGDFVTLNGNSEVFNCGVFAAWPQNVPSFYEGPLTITGFNSTDSFEISASQFADWSALQPHIAQSGANTTIALDSFDVITLVGVSSTSLTSSQFTFV